MPMTRPKQTVTTATIVSMVMSRGSDDVGVTVGAGVEAEDSFAVLAEKRTECSWAE